MSSTRTRIATVAAAALAAGAAVLGAAGSAAAAGAQGTGVSTFHPYAVVHIQPKTGSPTLGHLQGEGPDTPAGVYDGVCWQEGGHVDDGNFAHNKWVRVASFEGGTNGWVWAGNLKGNETGNVPNHC